MKFFHLADLHIGKIVNGFSMLPDQRFVLKQVLKAAQQERPAAVLLAGDLYDRPIPSGSAVHLLDWFLTQLSVEQIPCLAVAGNHDSGARLSFAAGILEKQNLYLSGNVTKELTHVPFQEGSIRAEVWLMPYIRPAEAADCFPSAHIQSYDDGVRAVLAHQKLNQSVCNLLVAHQFVTGAGVTPERSESEAIHVGGVDNVDCAAFAAFDYVALGHLHRPQQVGSRCRYAGSLLPYSFSERKHQKSITVVEVGENRAVQTRQIPLLPRHPMRELRGPLEELVKPEIVAQGEREDYLRVTLTDEQEPENAAGRLRAVYPNLMRLEFDNRRTQQGELLLAAEQEEALSLEELFQRFFAKQNGREMEETSRTLMREILKQMGDEEA